MNSLHLALFIVKHYLLAAWKLPEPKLTSATFFLAWKILSPPLENCVDFEEKPCGEFTACQSSNMQYPLVIERNHLENPPFIADFPQGNLPKTWWFSISICESSRVYTFVARYVGHQYSQQQYWGSNRNSRSILTTSNCSRKICKVVQLTANRTAGFCLVQIFLTSCW